MLELLARGGVGGLVSAAVAHLLTTLLDRAAGSETWLKGPHGPPFFNIALFMGLMYGGIALCLSRRQRDAAIGILGPSLGIAVPMAALSRLSWNLPWLSVVVAIFVAAVWGTIFFLGRRLTRRWLGGAAACAGSFCGYLTLRALTAVAPGLLSFRMNAYLPAPIVLLDGGFTGAGIGLAVYLIRRRYGDFAGS